MPLLNIAVFALNGFWCFLCGKHLDRSFVVKQNRLHGYLSKFFYSFTVFFVIIVFSALISQFNLEIIALSFNDAIFFLFLGLAFFIQIPVAMKFPKLSKLSFWIFFIIGTCLAILNIFYSHNSLSVYRGWIIWDLYPPIKIISFIASALVGIISTLFFLIGSLLIRPAYSRYRSIFLAIASILLAISTAFLVAKDLFLLNLSYISALFGYFMAYLGISYNISHPYIEKEKEEKNNTSSIA